MGLFDFVSGLFGDTKKNSGQSTSWKDTQFWTPEQKTGAATLGNYLNQQIGKSLPAYEGNRTAGLTNLERVGLTRAGNYAKSGMPGQYRTANQALHKVLAGDYKPIVDPAATNALYQSIRNRVMTQDLPELQNQIAKNANLSGMYHSGGHSKQQAQETGNVATRLAETLANLKYQDEQDRRNIAREREARSFAAIPTVMNLGEAMNSDKLRKAAAAMQYGALPRSLAQADLDNRYGEFLRTQPGVNPAIAQMLQYLQTKGMADTYTKQKGTGTSQGFGGVSDVIGGAFDIGSLFGLF